MRPLIITSLAAMAVAVTILDRDIVILGGGSSGTYAAVQLVDQNQSVVVIEKQGRLGGATHTYYDPDTGRPFDFGVQFYYPTDLVTTYLKRLEIPTAGVSISGTTVYADFAESVLLPNFTYTYASDYSNELAKYPYLEDGYYLPEDIPEDLLLPWVEYVEKNNITTSAVGTFREPNPAGQPLERLALFEFNGLNSVMLGELGGDAIHDSNGDNSAIYAKATSVIGAKNLLFNATVISGTRNETGVQLLVSTPTGKTLIRAKQLIVAAPPNASNLAPIDLNSHEEAVLSQIVGYPFYIGIVSNTGLPDNYTLENVGAKTEYNVPNLPYVVSLTGARNIPGVFAYAYSTLTEGTQAEVEANVTAAIKNLQSLLTTEGSSTSAEPTYLEFHSVGPFHPEQSADAIRNGFWTDMYNLQGYRNTWYISALFVLNSAQIWNSTAALLPDILAAAQKMA
ncbi:FAD/NAD(P)-binding domain-containing protein [Penicillium canescens]|nr:FAD/NAD(P)-binding domain-containing protein [Penicillium canescens]